MKHAYWPILMAGLPLTTLSAAADRTPVVVELFTSEGCSSCPPADALLDRLERAQPVPGAEVIALEQHVDYWNRLGWADPFSSAAITARQQAYSKALGADDVYTPQMIVEGRAEFVGSDTKRAEREIRRSAMEAHAAVSIREHGDGALSLRVGDIPAALRNGVYDVVLVISETNLASDVKRGENAGRKLRHASVVRSLTNVGTLDTRKSDSFSLELPLILSKDWKRENLHAVLLVQERHSSRRILGAASVKL